MVTIRNVNAVCAPFHPRGTTTMEATTLKFEAWQSAVDPGFWAELARRKLDTIGLSEDPVRVEALYAPASNAKVSSPAQLDRGAFADDDGSDAAVAKARDALAGGRARMPGTLYNVNTLERFREADRADILFTAAYDVWRAITTGEAERDPSLLNAFALLTFADLKRWSFTYWFAFPAIKLPEPIRVETPPTTLASRGEPGAAVAAACDEWLSSGGAFAWLVAPESSSSSSSSSVSCHPLTEFHRLHMAHGENVTLAFADPCASSEHPGWALRNLATLAAHRWRVDAIRVLRARRSSGRVSADASLELVLRLPRLSPDALDENAPCPGAVGWELNPRGRAGPRAVDLGASMDPERLASQAVDLNLKLMRWRLLPELDRDGLAGTRCLLLGAGTLGCAVARCLLAWGVRKITFVDSGKVSFSNPVRQSLFEFADCLEGGAPKAAAAAEHLRRIFPGVESEGHRIAIPMPGHPVSDADREEVLSDVRAVERLVDAHDVVFLLTDTRESRWLPTLMCAAKDKLLINAALGFDSYLVMRHGAGVADEGEGTSDRDEDATATARLGCYFCNDVMAPGNSTADRTLDQQCTVTRPGLAPIAGALAVELMVAMRHARREGEGDDDRDVNSNSKPDSSVATSIPADAGPPPPGESARTPLGIVPHQIRGHVADYRQSLFAAPAFPRCTACSAAVVRAFRSADRDAFLTRAFADPTYLEDETGLTAVHEAADAAEWVGGDSDEDDF